MQFYKSILEDSILQVSFRMRLNLTSRFSKKMQSYKSILEEDSILQINFRRRRTSTLTESAQSPFNKSDFKNYGSKTKLSNISLFHGVHPNFTRECLGSESLATLAFFFSFHLRQPKI